MNMYETVIGSHRVTKVPAGPGVLANCCRQLINQILLIPYQAVQLITGPVSEILCKSCLEIGCVGDPCLGAEKVTTGLALLLAQTAAKSHPQQETVTVCQPLAGIWSHVRGSSHPVAPPWKQELGNESMC